MRATFGPSEEGILQALVGDRWEEAFEVYLDLYEQAHDAGALVFSDVTSEVERLAAADIPQAVVTGKGMRSAEVTLGHIGIESAFDDIAAGSMEGSVKSREIARIADAWGFERGEVAYMGDHASDVTHARAAGAVAVSVAWAPDADIHELRSAEPDALLFTSRDLTTWLNANIEGLAP